MNTPTPTPLLRLAHMNNLHIFLGRQGLHAPSHEPDDGLKYQTIHNRDIQDQRRVCPIPCGPRGVVHDYVAFYFGPRSPMLYQLHTGWVSGYTDGQEPLIYLVSTAQSVAAAGCRFVFSDGHGIARFTQWFDDLQDLNKVDWEATYARVWKDSVNDMDRQRRKQAEFLVHQFCPWSLIREIAVVNDAAKRRVEAILRQFPGQQEFLVSVKPDWYY
jgi:hypothetical protein